jgi:beta-lactamase regulating signal transducer with metallopeptidase domain
MNAWLPQGAWSEFAAVLALELLVLFAVARLIATRIHSAQRLRNLWQITLVAMLLVFVGELNGVRGWLRFPDTKNTSTAPTRAVVVTIKETVEPTLVDGPRTLTETLPPKGVQRTEKRTMPATRTVVVSLIVVWLVITVALLARIAGAQILTLIFRTRARRCDDLELADRVKLICGQLGIQRGVLLARSCKVAAPFTFGVWRPVIVLPYRFRQNFTPEQQQVALAHELAHVASFDSAWRTLGNILHALLWWHPCVWLAMRELDRASELAADESSLLVADGPAHLAECLLLCAKSPGSPALTAWLGMDGGGFRSGLGKRVERLLGLKPCVRSRPLPWPFRIVAPMLCVFTLLLLVALMSPAPREGKTWRGSLLGSAFAAVADEAGNAKPKEPEKSPGPLPTTHVREAGLHTRVFRLDPNRLPGIALPPADGLKDARLYDSPAPAPPTDSIAPLAPRPQRRPVASDGASLRAWFKTYLASAGANFDAPGKSVFWNDRMNMLMVRGSEEDLAAAEKALQGALTGPTQDVLERPQAEPGGGGTGRRFNESEGEPLHTRFFKIDPVTFERGVQSLAAMDFKGKPAKNMLDDGSETNHVITRFRLFMESAGVDLSATGKAVFISTTKGMLMIRATLRDLETVEQTVAALNTNPPQLTIRVKAVEVARDANRTNEFDWFLGTLLNDAAASTSGPNANVIEVRNPNLVNSGLRNSLSLPAAPPPTITGVLTDEQFHTVLRALEQRGGTDLLSAPDVTTLSGRQAQIKVVDIRYIVTDLDYGTNATPAKSPGGANPVTVESGKPNEPRPIAEPFEIGPVIDLIPHVLSDGWTIQLNVVPTLREFLGYDDPATTGVPAIASATTPVPLPRFRVRQAATTAMVYDGQTLVVGAGSARHAQQEQNADGTTTTNFTEKALFFFITPRLVDPAGNSVHSAEQLKAMHQSVPRQ